MDEYNQIPQRPVNPRRRKRTKMQIFKESYLPVIIAGAALLLIIVLIIGSIASAGSKKKPDPVPEESTEATLSAEEEKLLLNEEAATVMLKAEALAARMDYEGAIAAIDSFSGNIANFPDMAQLRDEYVLAQSQLVAWSDPNQVLHLSVQMLIADPDRAFNDDMFSNSFRKNFLTTDEFTSILPILYQNGYVLVGIDDIITTQAGPSGGLIYAPKTLYLPQGKKPLLLTQTNVNYPNYLIDSDLDNIPDRGGCGFASKLVIDSGGRIVSEYVDADGKTVTGNYDMIPILNDFIEQYPDFSYQGARAIIALSGYEGLFGHRTDPEREKNIGTAAYEEELNEIRTLAQKLQDQGYTLACFTYSDESYANMSATEIQADLAAWNEEIVPILGNIDILAYSRDGDIAGSNSPYAGEKFDILTNQGFKIFLGFCDTGASWSLVNDAYVRLGRTLLTPANIRNHPDWFGNLLDPDMILDVKRGDISG